MKAVLNVKRENNNRLFYKSYQNGWGIFSFHSQIELYFVDEGEMEVWVGDRKKLLRAGEMSVALSYEPHTYHTPVASKSSVLIIPQYMCEEFVAETKSKKAANPFICDPETVQTIRAYYEKIKDERVGAIERQGYIYVILGIVLDNIFLENAEESYETSLSSKLLLFINQNYKNGITPGSIAAHFGYSQSYISRYFKSSFRITLGEYLNTLKLKNALMLLHEQKHSITYCALESGFSSVRTFYRAFSKEYGCSPKDFFKNIET
ncbi:MAG: helix-turn-helix domain-containing protein [Clostridia bacterium]|nr:helix-turn-helix domain-containing protein [Clostridia bacterium]